LALPAALIGSAVSQVFYQKASAIYNEKGDLKSLVKNTMFGLSLLAFPIFAVIFIWGDAIFAFVLSDLWRTSGEYAQILSIWMFMKFIVSPVSNIPMILNRQKKMFYLSLLGNSIVVLAIVIGGVYQNILIGFYILVPSQIIYYFFFIRWIIRITSSHK
jgi:O-antigen/teichoic acid export membrane protein